MLQLVLFVIIALLTIGQLFPSSNQSGGSAIYNMIKGGGKSRKGKK
jgi:hypothetical protein